MLGWGESSSGGDDGCENSGLHGYYLFEILLCQSMCISTDIPIMSSIRRHLDQNIELRTSFGKENLTSIISVWILDLCETHAPSRV